MTMWTLRFANATLILSRNLLGHFNVGATSGQRA